MADQSTLDIYAELYKRNAVPAEHKSVVDELVRRGVIGGQKKVYGPGDKLEDGTILDDQGLERGNILPIARDPNTNSLSLAVPGMLYQPFSAFKKSAETGTISRGDLLGIAGLGITGTRFPSPASPNAQSSVFGRGIRRAENAGNVAREFEAAGVPEFAPATAGDGVATTANRLMSGYFGGSLRNQAVRSIEGVERGVQDTIAQTGAARSANEIGTEAQGFLRRQITSRNPDVVPENMTAFQLQDISGVGPGLRAPPNAPPVQRVQPEQWNPQRRQVTPEEVDRAIPPVERVRTQTPPEIMPDNVPVPPEIAKAVSDTKARHDAGLQLWDKYGDQYTKLANERQKLMDRYERWGTTPPAKLAERVKRIDAELDRLEGPLRAARDDMEAHTAAANRIRDYQNENYALYRETEVRRLEGESENLHRLRREEARRSTEERLNVVADAEYQNNLNDPARRTAFENQARNRARAETERRQNEADVTYRADLAQRQAQAIPQRVGGNSRQPYNTEFDAGYEATRRNTPPMQMNPLGRPNDTTPTETVQLLDSIAMDYRKQGLLPGYRPGEIFGEDGTLRPEVLQIISSLGGPGVSERIRAISLLRPRGAAQLGIDGLDKIRTAIGQALSDARQKPIGGLTQGEGASQRARAAFLARLYDAIGTDVDQAVARVPGGELASAQRAVLRDSYKSFMTEIRGPLSKVFGEKTTPEQAVKMLKDAARGGDRGNLNLLNAYFRVADEKGDRVRATGVLLNSMAEGGLEGFLASYRGMPPEVRAMLARGDSAPIIARLDQLARVGGYLERFARNARPDQNVSDVARRAANAPNVLTALMAYINAPTALVMVGGQAAASRALASPAFRRWLHRVPQAKTQKEMSDLLRRLSQVGAVEMGLAPGNAGNRAREVY